VQVRIKRAAAEVSSIFIYLPRCSFYFSLPLPHIFFVALPNMCVLNSGTEKKLALGG